MKRHPDSQRTASTLVVTLVTLAALSLMAAYTLIRVRPRTRMAYQNAAWQESRIAAEAGIDSAMNDLILNATGFAPATWSNWQEDPSPSLLNGLLKSLKELPDTKLNLMLGQIADQKAAKDNGLVTTLLSLPLSLLGTPPVSTKSLYLDNVKISAARGLPAEVDVQMWGLEPSLNPHSRWYRIRSMGTCPLPPTAYENPDNLDGSLRRFNLRQVRSSHVGAPSTIPLPNVSRTVEVLVEPILAFELALWTGERISLTSPGTWNIDSFDSSDTAKSSDKQYPGRGSPLVQANGSVASSASRSADTLKRATIAANGTEIRGAVATNGGDDPKTKEHENVSGAVNVDPERIHDDFSRQMVPVVRPPGEFLPAPLLGTFLTGPVNSPTIYSIHGNLSQIKIASLGTGKSSAVVIMVDGDVDLAKPLIIPPSVIAVLYVRGQITLRDNVNSGPWNSNQASQLLIFGDCPAPQRQTLQVLGNSSVCAAFYGPTTNVTLEAGVNWIGSLNALSMTLTGSGNGGIHYDESLATIGPTIGFRIARFIEDVRE